MQTLKIHFLDSHLELIAENLGPVSDEQGEGFYEDIINGAMTSRIFEMKEC